MSEPQEVLLQASRFTVLRRRHQTAAGIVVTREWVQHPGSVTIVPVLDDGRVCLIRNVRVAVGETLLELPAGTLDREESPEATAHRELAEETGFHCRKLVKLQEFFLSPGILNERMHLFEATGLTPGVAHPEAGEEIENVLVSWAEALAMAQDGRIHDAKTLVGLLLAAHLRRL